MKKAVMYGGGNIGRGFIGATLSQSGYEVTFIDVAEPVVKALQEKASVSRPLCVERRTRGRHDRTRHGGQRQRSGGGL